MSDERDSVGRRSDEHLVLFVADDEESLARADGFGFEDSEFRAGAVFGSETLPVFEEPGAGEKEGQDERERAEDAENGAAEIGNGRGRRWGVGEDQGGCGGSGAEEE